MKDTNTTATKKQGVSVFQFLRSSGGLPATLDKERAAYDAKYPERSLSSEFARSYHEFGKFFYLKAKKTFGVVVASEKVNLTMPSEGDGLRTTIEYVDTDGCRVTCSDSSELDWACSKEQYDTYYKQRQPGSYVIIFYDPDETHLYELHYLD